MDTGAEVCLIRRGLLPEFLFQPAENPLRLIAVNKQRLAGGDKEVLITMVFSGTHVIDKKAVEMRIPTWVYSADIREDVIFSYEWCQLRGVDISARKHGLLCIKSGQEFWIDGVRVAAADKPDTLVRVVEGYRLWPCTSPPIPSHDVIPEIVVTPPQKRHPGALCPKRG